MIVDKSNDKNDVVPWKDRKVNVSAENRKKREEIAIYIDYITLFLNISFEKTRSVVI